MTPFKHGVAPFLRKAGAQPAFSVTDRCQRRCDDGPVFHVRCPTYWSVLTTSRNCLTGELGHLWIQVRTLGLKYGQYPRKRPPTEAASTRSGLRSSPRTTPLDAFIDFIVHKLDVGVIRDIAVASRVRGHRHPAIRPLHFRADGCAALITQ